MPLAGEGGDYQAKRLQKGTNLYACVEFKYPVSSPYKDNSFKNDPIGGELLVKSLCETLGPGVLHGSALRLSRDADVSAKDEDWPGKFPGIEWPGIGFWTMASYISGCQAALFGGNFARGRPCENNPRGN